MISPFQYQQMRERLEGNQIRHAPTPEQAVDMEISGLHEPIMKWCHDFCVPYIHAIPTKRSRVTPGAPDFTVVYKGKVWLIECKSATGELRPDQLAWMRQAQDQGVQVHVITNFQSFLELIRS